MIIDQILDRMESGEYAAREFYAYCNGNGECGNMIARAMDAGTEEDIQSCIEFYIRFNGYSDQIIEYVKSVKWIN